MNTTACPGPAGEHRRWASGHANLYDTSMPVAEGGTLPAPVSAWSATWLNLLAEDPGRKARR